MRIIIGLGNPGEKYLKTRHNVGFTVLDKYAEKMGLVWEHNKKFNADIAKTPDLILLKPLTFMNNSGQAVRQVLSYYKLLQKKFGLLLPPNLDLSALVTVVHDEVDIDLGKYKTSCNSRSAGHRGVESIIMHLKTKNFKRIRIGVKTEALKNIPVEKFVLQNFSDDELAVTNKLLPEILALI
jgi:PTH1 family peptidyl-tRNA hydrolase